MPMCALSLTVTLPGLQASRPLAPVVVILRTSDALARPQGLVSAAAVASAVAAGAAAGSRRTTFGRRWPGRAHALRRVGLGGRREAEREARLQGAQQALSDIAGRTVAGKRTQRHQARQPAKPVPPASGVASLRERCVQPWDEFLADCGTSFDGRCVVALCGAAPGNTGAILRSCAVLGVAAVCVLGAGHMPREDVKTALRVSQIDRKPHWDTALVPLPADVGAEEMLGRLRQTGFHIVGLTAAEGGASGPPRPLWEVDLTHPRLVLVFGKDEEDGIAFPDGAGVQLDAAAIIPMRPGTDDMLNLASTVAAVVYERHRQLAMSPGAAGLSSQG